MKEKELDALERVLIAARTLCHQSRLVVQDVHGNGRPVPNRGLLEQPGESISEAATTSQAILIAMRRYEIDLLKQLPGNIAVEDLVRTAEVLNRLCSRFESREWSDLVAKW